MRLRFKSKPPAAAERRQLRTSLARAGTSLAPASTALSSSLASPTTVHTPEWASVRQACKWCGKLTFIVCPGCRADGSAAGCGPGDGYFCFSSERNCLGLHHRKRLPAFRFFSTHVSSTLNNSKSGWVGGALLGLKKSKSGWVGGWPSLAAWQFGVGGWVGGWGVPPPLTTGDPQTILGIHPGRSPTVARNPGMRNFDRVRARPSE